VVGRHCICDSVKVSTTDVLLAPLGVVRWTESATDRHAARARLKEGWYLQSLPIKEQQTHRDTGYFGVVLGDESATPYIHTYIHASVLCDRSWTL